MAQTLQYLNCQSESSPSSADHAYPEIAEYLIFLVGKLANSKAEAAAKTLRVEELPAELDHLVANIDKDHGGTLEEPLIIKKTIEVVLPDRQP